jgi:quinol monooxygenase YgiN
LKMWDRDVFIFEAYDDASALDAHRLTDHFKKYAGTAKGMVAKTRDPSALVGCHEYEEVR